MDVLLGGMLRKSGYGCGVEDEVRRETQTTKRQWQMIGHVRELEMAGSLREALVAGSRAAVEPVVVAPATRRRGSC